MIMFVSSPVVLSQPVDFEDENLKALVQEELGGQEPTRFLMLSLTRLSARNRDISDLTGLEHAPNLYDLNLDFNQISNLSPLAGLTNLEDLSLEDNQITNLSPLAGLTNLEDLSLEDNQITNLSPLAGLTNLGELHLQSNQITNLSPLAGLTNLVNLLLQSNQISNISPLIGLTSLGILSIERNPLNQEACDIYIPQMRANGTVVDYDPCISIETLEATNITETTATLRGRLVEDSGFEPGGARCRWRRSDQTQWNEPAWLNIEKGETFSQPVSGLDPGTTYVFQAQLINHYDIYNGAEFTFRTQYGTGPSIETLEATDVTDTSATLWGRLIEDGGIAPGGARCRWRRSDQTQWNEPQWLSVREGETFSQPVSGLDPDTEYVYQAQVINHQGTYNGQQRVFHTLPEEPVLVTVPDVVGMSGWDAASEILGANLDGEALREYSDTVPRDHVISQDPAAGTLVPARSIVLFTVSNGPEFVVVPDVVGMHMWDSLEVLGSVGLDDDLCHAYSYTIPKLHVIDQYPAAGTLVPYYSVVVLLLSLGPVGPDAVTVPDVVGMSETDADSEITGAGLWGHHVYEHNDTVPKGHVIRQIPPGGSLVDASYYVILTVSLGPSGPTMVTVPDVVGMNENDADSEITSADLEVSHTYEHSDIMQEGCVISQSPSAGASVAVGSYVDLTVSLGPSIRGPYYVDTRATGRNDGSSWANAFNRLQDAMAVVAAGDEIRVARGIYKPDQGRQVTSGDRNATFRLINGVRIQGGYAGYGASNPDARDIALYETILSGDLAGNDREVADPCELLNEPTLAENSLHVVMAVNCDSSTVLDGLTITAGNASEQETPQNQGGGLYLDNTGSPTLRDCTFIHNTAAFGAGIYANYNGHSNPTLIRCNFIENNAQHGGALYVSHNSEAHLIDCLFEGNVVAGAGAGIHLYQGRVALTGCRFVNNEGESSGAIYAKNSEYTLVGCSFEGNLVLSHGSAIRDINSVSEISDCNFSGNIAGGTGGAASFTNNALTDMLRCSFINNEAGYGGAVYLNTVNPVLVDCSFVSNICTYKGGAIYNYGSPLSLINCRLTDNASAGAGGAVYNYGSPLSLINCRLTDNASAGAGGAVYNNQSGEALYCGTVFSVNTAVGQGGAVLNDNCQQTNYTVNCTFAGNRSENAGGGTADVNSVHVMANSILWGNEAPTGPQAMVRNGIASLTVRYCNLQGGQADVQVVGAQLAWESGNLATDPLFVDAQEPDNGLALRAGSPCIDAGDNTWIPADMADLDVDGNTREKMPLDLSGHTRFVNDPATVDTGWPDLPTYRQIVDMGAFEYQDPYSGTLDGMTLPHVAFIHGRDVEAVKADESFSSLILSYGCTAKLIDQADVGTAPLDAYDLIIAGTSASFYFGQNPEAVTAVEHSGKPVLGLAAGGCGFLGRLGLDIGHPHEVYWNDQTSIEVIDPGNPLFSIPYEIDIPEDRVLPIHIEGNYYVGLRRSSIPETVDILGTQGHGIDLCPLVMEQDQYVLWAFKESPQNMTEEGKLLFINVVIRAANRAWDN